LSVHHQYSSSVSPFHAKTLAVPARTIAEAAWSWVEKMLHDTQRTSAPSASSVSMRTPVWIVMWSEPMMRTPASGCAGPNSLRDDMRPGISYSARSYSLRPKSESDMSATLKSPEDSTGFLTMFITLAFGVGFCGEARASEHRAIGRVRWSVPEGVGCGACARER